MPAAEIPPTPRTTVRRSERAGYDRDAVHAVLDEGLVAHVGLTVDGQPYVIPMAYARHGDRLVLHGSVATRLMRRLDAGVPLCVTVTLLDGLVLSRSRFHHSMNYRSVVVLGTGRRIRDPRDAGAALDALVDHVVPGRTAHTRPGSPVEIRQTAVIEVPIEEASLKARTGGPGDEPEDLSLSAWAGVVPLSVVAGPPVPSDDLDPAIPVPDHVRSWRRPTR